MENHNSIGKTHYKWAIFLSKLFVYQRVNVFRCHILMATKGVTRCLAPQQFAHLERDPRNMVNAL